MTGIISAVISACAAIICAVIGRRTAIKDKKNEERAEQRAKESLLSMQLMNANCKLTVGVAMALKRGQCNGEVEEGLAAVEEATKAYEDFHSNLVIKQLSR